MRRFARIASLAVLASLLITGGIAVWGYISFTSPGPLTEGRTVLIPKGAGLKRIAGILGDSGVIRRPSVFVAWAALSGDGRAIKAGEYAFAAGQSPQQVLALMVEGKVVLRRLTVPEGLTSVEIKHLVEGAEALEGHVLAPEEGTVLPETYSYQYGDTRTSLLEHMKSAMRESLARLWAERAAGLPFEQPEQAVILASIVEKETAVPEERARIAGVFINRLRKGMRLQSDPTVVYGLTKGAGPLGRVLTRADLDTEHAYNTYQRPGLPPGPICNPGRDSLAAVLKPAPTDELYFVADGNGGHVFSRTLEEHNRNVARWRRIERGHKRD